MLAKPETREVTMREQVCRRRLGRRPTDPSVMQLSQRCGREEWAQHDPVMRSLLHLENHDHQQTGQQ